MRPFYVYEGAGDGNDLGYWRLDTAGLDCVFGGPSLTNNGAKPVGGGYRFVRADGNYMDLVLASQPERSAITIEAWVKSWGNDPGDIGCIAILYLDGDNNLILRARRESSTNSAYIQAQLMIGGTAVGLARLLGADAEAILTSSGPWHIAGVLDAPSRLSLYVDGVKRAEDTTDIAALPAGDYLFRLGRYGSGWNGYDLSAILDDVRLSSIARYSSDFAICRFGEGKRAVVRGPGVQAGLCAGVFQ